MPNLDEEIQLANKAWNFFQKSNFTGEICSNREFIHLIMEAQRTAINDELRKVCFFLYAKRNADTEQKAILSEMSKEIEALIQEGLSAKVWVDYVLELIACRY